MLTALVYLTRHVSPRPSDAVDRIAQDQGELTAQEQLYIDNFPIWSQLGALLYPSVKTRLDIAYAVNLLSRFGAKPTLPTYKLMVYLLQYGDGTLANCIRVSWGVFDMHVFTDADWAGDMYSRADP